MTDLLTRIDVPLPGALDAPPSALSGSVAEDLVLAVAPSTGRFQPSGAQRPDRGELLGHVTGGRGRADAVIAPVPGEVARVLVRPGQLVAKGQGLVWLCRSPR
jgi:biotin carboxyl carrier protein